MRFTSSTCFTLAGLLAFASAANATVFYIDDFKISQNGDLYWHDSFGDGSAPQHSSAQNPAAVDVNTYNRAYATSVQPQLPGIEANGKLTLDTDTGSLNIGAIYPVENRALRARVLSATNPASNATLKVTDDIEVTGVFDLTRPDEINDKVSIRLTDFTSTTKTEALEIAMNLAAGDTWEIDFRQGDVGVQWNSLQTWSLDGIGNIFDYEQIALSLFNDTSSASGEIFNASFTLMDSDAILADQTFTSSTNGLMFQNSDYVRGSFTARERVEVPEPPFVVLSGLVLLALRRGQTATRKNK